MTGAQVWVEHETDASIKTSESGGSVPPRSCRTGSETVRAEVGSAEARRTGDAGADAILAVEVNGGRARFAADVKSRAPYPGELRGMAQA